MKITKPAVILLALVFLTAAIAQPAKEPTKPAATPAEPKLSNTLFASCLVKVTSDPTVMPINEIVIECLLRSSGVVGKAAQDVLGISSDDAVLCEELFTIEDLTHYSSGGSGIPPTSSPSGVVEPLIPTPRATPTRPTTSPGTRRPTTPRAPSVTNLLPSAAEQTILFKLQVGLGDSVEETVNQPVKHAAEEFMIAIIDNLRKALRGAFDEYRSKLDDQLNLVGEEAQRAEIDLVQMQAKLRDISGSRDLSRNVILRDIGDIRQMLQTAKMEQASNSALIEATTKRIAGEQARRKELVENDPIAKEFKSILDMHERRLKDTQKLYEAGRASTADMEDIREKNIRARIELAQRQEEVSNPPGSLRLSSLNVDVGDLSTKVALAQQEIRSFGKQLEEAEDMLKMADTYELLSLKADIARQNLEETLLWRARLGRNIRSIQPPDVTVIGAE
jgi:hypothetical protein